MRFLRFVKKVFYLSNIFSSAVIIQINKGEFMTTIHAITPYPTPPETKLVNDNKKEYSPRISVKDVLLVQSVPLVAGGGHAIKTFFENKGKASAYQDLLKTYKKGSTQYKNIENCIEFAKKNMKNAKLGGIILVTTMALSAAYIAIANACCKTKTNIEEAINTEIKDIPVETEITNA